MDQRQLTGLLTATAIAVAGAGVVALYWPSERDVPATAAPPERPGIYTIYFEPAGPAATSVALPARATPTFGLLGVTWTNPKLAPHGTIQVRTRSVATGAWTSWKTLDTDDSQGPDSGGEGLLAGRGGTEPLWVGDSNGVAARVVGRTGRAARALPGGLRLDLIDSSPADSADSGGQGGGGMMPASSVGALPATAAAAPFRGLPSYVSRARWRANERLVRERPHYGTSVKVLFVHHTAGTNNYSCAQSAAIIRSIQAYQVLSKGWDDIGYNFLVDKCGTLFEGRRGGVSRPVVGAHTYGFNTNSAGIAVLGTYSSRKVPPAVATTIARVAAYKLGLSGYEPKTNARLTEAASDGKYRKGKVVSFPRISGHRDAVVTECPGNALYAQLPGIRLQAAALFYGFAAKPVTGGVSTGGAYYVRRTATLNWANRAGSGTVKRFELIVDGRTVRTLPGTVRSAKVTLSDGRHRVAVRATYRTNTRLITKASTVFSDTKGPVFTRPPELTFRTGTVSPALVPVTLNWKATDAVKLSSVTLKHPGVGVFGPSVTAWNVNAKVGATRNWQMTATDAVGNTTDATATRTPTLIPESAAVRSGTWVSKTNTAYVDGRSLASTTKGSSLTWTFTGRAVGLIVSHGTISGQVDILVDGKFAQTLDLRSGVTRYRDLIWQRSFTGSAQHTLSVVVKGTAGRPGVTVDGLIALA